jgi:sugar (pentulose or hexulose) kinase
MSSRASGWWRGSASTPDPRCAGSGIKGSGPPRAARRATPGWSNWRRRCRPEHAASPRGWPPADAWTWAHWQPPFPSPPTAGTGEQARAIQEAAAYSTRLTAGLISEMPGPGGWHTVILTSGAARSTLWPQIPADVLGSPVSVPDHVESAVLGAAVLAGRGAGVLHGAAADDPPGAERESLGPGRVAYPSPAGRQAYDLLYERWATCRRGISPPSRRGSSRWGRPEQR